MATISWLNPGGGLNGDWATKADWRTGAVPGAADDVIINDPGTYTVTVLATDPAEFANSVTLNAAGATLAIAGALGGAAGAGSLTTGNFLVENGGTATIGATSSNAGVVGLHVHAVATVTGDFTNSGTLNVDNVTRFDAFGNLTYSEGGSSLSLGGTLTNTAGHTITIGSTSLNAQTTLAAAGLNNAGPMSLAGSSATKNVSATIAGPVSNTGTLSLNRTNLNITTGALNSTGDLEVHQGSSITTAAGFDLTVGGTFNIDTTTSFDAFGNLTYSEGGSSLSIGGALTNNATIKIGSSFLNAATTLTAAGLGTLGNVTLTGSASKQAGLVFTAAAAPAAAAVKLLLSGDALLQFASGGVASIGATGLVSLTGNARIADAGNTAVSSALSTLASNLGDLELHGAGGASPAISTNAGTDFTNSGTLNVDNVTRFDAFGNLTYSEGGSSLSLGGTLTNTAGHTITIGSTSLNAQTTLAAAGLNNAGPMSLAGSSATKNVSATIAGPVSNTGILNVGSFSSLNATGGNAFVQTAGTTTVRGTLTAASIDIFGGLLAVDTTTFTNNTTLWASTGGVIDFTNGGLTNLSGGTLTGGVYEVDANSTIKFASSAPLTTDNANIILKGTASVIESGTTTINAQLTTIAAAGALHLFSGANFNSATGFTDNGLIDLNAGTFAAGSITVGATGTIHGNGTVAAIVQNSGIVDASGGNLIITKAANGVGTFTIEAASSLEFDSTVQSGASITFGGIGSTLRIGGIAANPTAFAGTLANFAPGETIDLLSTIATSATTTPSGITVNLQGGGTLSYAAPSLPSNLVLGVASDKNGGTDIVGYRLAQSGSVTPNPILFGQAHVGDIKKQFLTISNTAPADGYSEALDASIGGTGNITVAGTVSLLPPQTSDSADLSVTLKTASDGLKIGTVTVTPVSDGTVLDGTGLHMLPAQPITATGTVFNLATASAVAPVDFSVVHVGTNVGEVVSKTLSISNTATADGFSENLDASIAGAPPPFTASGGFTGLAPGATNASSLTVGLNTGTSGIFSGMATITPISDGGTIDTLGTTVLQNLKQTITVTGTVDNYAQGAWEKISGGGTFTKTGSNTWSLDFGSVALGAAAPTANLGALNAAPGLADLMSGSFQISGDGVFLNSGLADFSGLGAGQADTAPTVSLSTSRAGTFGETIILNDNGTNDSGYSGTGTFAAQQTLTVTGTVPAAPLSAFFDPNFYLAQNPDVKAAGVDALTHFETYGWQEGREPSLVFSDSKYLAANQDVKAAGVDPLLHYVQYGQYEGRMTFLSGGTATADPLIQASFYDPQLGATLIPTGSAAEQQAAWSYDTAGWEKGLNPGQTSLNPDPFFDSNFYLTQNPDVKAAGIDPLWHFENFGWKEGRDPSLVFSDSKYLNTYGDVKAAGIDPLLHYVLYGQNEGRMTFLSGGTAAADPLIQAAFYDPQLGATLIPTGPAAEQQAAWFYDNFGWQKGLNPDEFFDTNYYLSHNDDVKRAGIDPLLHYEQFGWKEGRDPSAGFSTNKYLNAYGDVKAAGIDPLLHYELYGKSEGRTAFPV